MSSYQVHTTETASQPAAELLKKAEEKYGFLPNILGVMAEAPSILKAYMTLAGIFDETSFTQTERQIVLLAVSLSNECEYCMAAHTAMANMQDVPDDVVEALRNNEPIKDNKLETLRRLAYEIADTKGNPTNKTVKAFLDAGYSQGQILEVILGVGFKTLSNYTNHVAETPLDEAFKPTEWRAQKAA
ncbi:MAG: carboxymuconolactone decarboxylase [Alphaproteobacteria bacterium CG_4_9_14_3_um_filter_47_13]|nr:MAG: carboxymuconolactone decarboxylase [Alphaproteobacteria bacterium CG_4_9_14_3_um_filter_47_13]